MKSSISLSLEEGPNGSGCTLTCLRQNEFLVSNSNVVPGCAVVAAKVPVRHRSHLERKKKVKWLIIKKFLRISVDIVSSHANNYIISASMSGGDEWSSSLMLTEVKHHI